jgi:hypothetical protein
MPPGIVRISQDVTDISSVSQLLGYATAGQIQQLLRQRRALTQGKIAQGAGFGSTSRHAGAALSAGLRRGLNGQQLQRLDEIIGALAPDLDGTGGLSSLALRLSGERRGEIRGSSLTARVPPSWARKILQEPNPGETGVLIQASALLSAFMAADKMDTGGMSITGIRDRYQGEIDKLVRRLILIAVGPPTSRNYDAQILLGSLASYAFDLMKDRLEFELRSAPLGFRVWRAITKLVKLSGQGEHAGELKGWVRLLMRDAEDLRKSSLYAGRSLDLETAVAVPASWSPPEDDWIGDALWARARNPEATIRERGTAAMGLWQRAIAEDRPDLDKTEEDLHELIREFKDPDSRPDAAAGLRWIALTLESAIGERTAVCNDWPDPGEPWFNHVKEAADELDNYDIPVHLRTGTKNLLKQMILQNAGVYRRHAIETVVTSGWNEPVARALASLLKKETDQAWLRVRAEFALGFLQRQDQQVEGTLTQACLQAYKNLRLEEVPAYKPPRAHITEMHSSLFAVGDCFGVAGAEDRARGAREKLRHVLTGLATTEGPRARIVRRAVRASAYVLVVTAQPRIGQEKDLSQELLEKLIDHEDDVTARFAQWALSFRFAPDGTIRPLLAAADHETTY